MKNRMNCHSLIIWSILVLITHYRLHPGKEQAIDVNDSNMENMNDMKYLNDHLDILLKQLHSLEAVPGLAIESGLYHKVRMCYLDKEQTPDRVQIQKEEEENPDQHVEVLKKEAEGEFAS